MGSEEGASGAAPKGETGTDTGNVSQGNRLLSTMRLNGSSGAPWSVASKARPSSSTAPASAVDLKSIMALEVRRTPAGSASASWTATPVATASNGTVTDLAPIMIGAKLSQQDHAGAWGGVANDSLKSFRWHSLEDTRQPGVIFSSQRSDVASVQKPSNRLAIIRLTSIATISGSSRAISAFTSPRRQLKGPTALFHVKRVHAESLGAISIAKTRGRQPCVGDTDSACFYFELFAALDGSESDSLYAFLELLLANSRGLCLSGTRQPLGRESRQLCVLPGDPRAEKAAGVRTEQERKEREEFETWFAEESKKVQQQQQKQQPGRSSGGSRGGKARSNRRNGNASTETEVQQEGVLTPNEQQHREEGGSTGRRGRGAGRGVVAARAGAGRDWPRTTEVTTSVLALLGIVEGFRDYRSASRARELAQVPVLDARGAAGKSHRSSASPRIPRGSIEYIDEDDDVATTETGSVAASTIEGSIVDSRIGSVSGPPESALNLEGQSISSHLNASGVALTAFNAIYTVLNHPTKRAEPINPQFSRYPPLPLSSSELPTARKADHAAYLAQIWPEWDLFRITTPKRATSAAALARNGAEGLLEEDFNLSSPHIFGKVVETVEPAARQNSSDSFEQALNQILQEKLSYYSDIIEQHLIAESCLAKVDALRSELAAIDEHQAKKGLQLVLRQAKRRELGTMQNALQQVKDLTDRRDMVDLLVKQGEFEEALDLMESIRSMLKRLASRSVAEADSEVLDISREPAHDKHISAALRQELLIVLGTKLRERITEPFAVPTLPIEARSSAMDQRNLRRQRHKSMRNSISIAAGQLNANGFKSLFESEGDATQEAVQRIPKSPKSSEVKNEALRTRVMGLVLGLVRTHGIERVIRDYEEVATELLQSIATSHIQGMSDDLIRLLAQVDAPTDN
ncbi:hypothetical protein K437DRAFT_268934 [Tilletiaria anomala UBC 951]|uniref:Vacuolar protein sorting-associated protein 54 N-terminal domain-containing protein n=1 Tax=Tilletiaria anomala (strain ATCC 24038 / CBS 436.72 / UBC 951) TaxID=1037660 RepID=A0A066VZI6_TILAU|nr:uncharacterized protein K437DRAFT_268934 [Tilletiaria anomala UBC 951]KDN43935.1 hypothetical protein K437DRAFT_268934 [Tilletiaria anomala UBC 951]